MENRSSYNRTTHRSWRSLVCTAPWTWTC